MRAALFSKSQHQRVQFCSDFLRRSGKAIAIYLYPKNRKKELIKPEASCSIHYETYEDMTKTEQWLQINSLIGDETVLILDNPSRYPKVTSTKVLALERLEKMVQHKVLIDIVPFTLDIQYLYQPISYLGRDILGYAHYYAWRENYHEVDEQGKIRSSHDFDLIVQKLRHHCKIDYPAFCCPDRQTIRFNNTTAEHQRYQELRAELFAAEQFSPQPTITKLADLVHAFESRYSAMLEILAGLQGRTLVYCNLSDYAKKAQAIARRSGFKNVIATSYQVGSAERFDNVIYLESPIVKSYFLLDAESRLHPECRVFHLVGDTKVDQYLYGLIDHELTQINGFTKELYRAVHRPEAIPQTVPSGKCVAGEPGAHQLDLFQLQDR